MSAAPSPRHRRRVLIRRLAPDWRRPAERAFCESLDQHPETLAAGQVLWADRNQLYRLKLTDPAGAEIVVKRFPITAPVRRLVYLVRSSKAVRSFDNAVRLAELGIGTPGPLAAIDVRHGGLPAVAFYVCEWLDHWMLARDLKFEGAPATPELLEALGSFVAEIHKRGVHHMDLTAGNVLMVKDGTPPAGVSFHLIDLNRVAFGPIGLVRGIANLTQLGDFPYQDSLRVGYCRGRGLPADRLRGLYRALLAVRTLRWTVKNRTRPLRRKLGL